VISIFVKKCAARFHFGKAGARWGAAQPTQLFDSAKFASFLKLIKSLKPLLVVLLVTDNRRSLERNAQAPCSQPCCCPYFAAAHTKCTSDNITPHCIDFDQMHVKVFCLQAGRGTFLALMVQQCTPRPGARLDAPSR
jgi:hypothetical protein